MAKAQTVQPVANIMAVVVALVVNKAVVVKVQDKVAHL
jgi:hypothetical protein